MMNNGYVRLTSNSWRAEGSTKGFGVCGSSGMELRLMSMSSSPMDAWGLARGEACALPSDCFCRLHLSMVACEFRGDKDDPVKAPTASR
jgi:hypothetical protein